MSRGHRHLRKKKDKPVRPMGCLPQLEVVKPEHAPDAKIHAERVSEKQASRGETIRPAIHGGYTHPWGLSYYETTVYPKGGG